MANNCQDRYAEMWYKAKQLLTEQQYKVFYMIGREGKSFRIVGNNLGISKVRVRELWQSAVKKVEEVK